MRESEGSGSKLELEESNSELVVRISLEDEKVGGMIKRAYEDLLRNFNYNVSALSRDLKIPRQSFYNKMKKYGIDLREVRKKG